MSRPTSLEWSGGNLWIGDRDLNRVFTVPDTAPSDPSDP